MPVSFLESKWNKSSTWALCRLQKSQTSLLLGDSWNLLSWKGPTRIISPTPGLAQDNPKNQTVCLRELSKCLLSRGTARSWDRTFFKPAASPARFQTLLPPEQPQSGGSKGSAFPFVMLNIKEGIIKLFPHDYMDECTEHPGEICPLSLPEGHWISQRGQTPLWMLSREMGGVIWPPWVAFLIAPGPAPLVPTVTAMSLPSLSPLCRVFRALPPDPPWGRSPQAPPFQGTARGEQLLPGWSQRCRGLRNSGMNQQHIWAPDEAAQSHFPLHPRPMSSGAPGRQRSSPGCLAGRREGEEAGLALPCRGNIKRCHQITGSCPCVFLSRAEKPGLCSQPAFSFPVPWTWAWRGDSAPPALL
ncbi:uncharacterized protein LOC107202756 [Parus major]|uniref:uncharacterized protein LOC107202756 n=1 Tax=Parus major TaxID=9157 RepID=UPI0007715A5D|nr:uncharacterized protein LOC107202756 [Parus major]